MKKRMDFTDYMALFFFGLMVVGGIAMIAAGASDLRLALASPSWPAASGVIRKSEFSAKTSRSSGSSRSSTMYYLKLAAGYQVNGTDYETGTVFYGFSGGSGDASEIKLEQLRYPAGAKVLVYHDPQEPSKAVLRPGFYLDVLGLPAAGVIVALAGLAFTFAYLGAFKEYPVLPLGVRLFGLVFVAAGAAMLTAGLWRLKLAMDSRTWPVAAGAVVYAEEHASPGELEESDGQTRTVTTYGAPLAYRYEVKGRTYLSSIRCFGALAGASRDWAQAILERYPAGKEVPVYYNPAAPDSAVLEPGVSTEAFWLPGAGAAALLFGIAAVILGFRI